MPEGRNDSGKSVSENNRPRAPTSSADTRQLDEQRRDRQHQPPSGADDARPDPTTDDSSASTAAAAADGDDVRPDAAELVISSECAGRAGGSSSSPDVGTAETDGPSRRGSGGPASPGSSVSDTGDGAVDDQRQQRQEQEQSPPVDGQHVELIDPGVTSGAGAADSGPPSSSAASTTPIGAAVVGRSPRKRMGRTPVKARGQWAHQIEFLLAILGYQVGYGNIWRFPYLLYENGGGTFLVPYVVAFLLVALPMVLLEEGAGQYAGLGAVKIYRAVCPAMKGVGMTSLCISWSCGVYFAIIMGWILVYCYYACYPTIPWSTCQNDWNTPECFAAADQEKCPPGQFFYDRACTSADNFCVMFGYDYTNASSACQRSAVENGTEADEIPFLRVTQRSLSAEEFFERQILGVFLEDGSQATWSNYGTIQWHLFAGLLAVWIMAAAAMIKGIQTTGKVLYFTAVFPYVIIMFFLVKGALLDGASEGIGYYLTPEPSKLLDFHVWYAAAAQIFFSSGISFGAHITLASYSSFDNNIMRDATLITVTNSVTSFLFGFIIFSMLGFLAKTLGTDVPHVVKDGIGLLFIIIPQSIVGMSIPNFWSWMFFLMIFTVGFCSLTGMMEVVTTAVFDQWPRARSFKTAVVVGVCSLSFLAGLPLCWSGGLYYLMLLNDYTINLPLFFVAMFNIFVFVGCFGYQKMMMCYEKMLGKMSCIWTRYSCATWKFATPIYLLVVFVASIVGSNASSKYGTYTFSATAHGIGFLTVALILLPVPIGFFLTLMKFKRKGQPLKSAFRETDEWMSSPDRETMERDKEAREALESKNDAAVGRGRVSNKLELQPPDCPAAVLADQNSNGAGSRWDSAAAGSGSEDEREAEERKRLRQQTSPLRNGDVHV